MSHSAIVKESEKEILHLSRWIGPTPIVNGVHSGPRPILRPVFMEIRSVAFG